MSGMISEFDDIRCYNDSEVAEALDRLVNEKLFLNMLTYIFPSIQKETLVKQLKSYTSILDFQKGTVNQFLLGLEATLTKGIKMYGLEKIDTSQAQLYISNHRDIILDSAFLCTKLLENNLDTVEIAIGDNLLVFPWIVDLVRVNKSFIVRRGLSSRQILESSELLSKYIAHTIQEKHQSIWIAQREGRAKDSNDTTQESLLKMFNMYGKSDLISNLIGLNICPLTISYEYDPCDFLKAKEFQLKRDNPNYAKTPQDDLINMQTGVMGYKGKIVYEVTGNIKEELQSISSQKLNKNEQIREIALLIDRRIHGGYTIFPNNMIAYDLLRNEKRFENEYTSDDVTEFEKYLSQQLSKIDMQNKDTEFLRTKLLEMYANPLINKLLVNL
jgi:Acyltransferase